MIGAEPVEADSLLRVEGLTVVFRTPPGPWRGGRRTVRAVDGVSFEVDGGRTLGLVGESGSGKSTTALAVMRLVEPAAGRVTFAGRDVLALRGGPLRAFRRQVQMVFQDSSGSLDPRLTAHAAVAEPLRIHGLVSRRGERSRVGELLELVGLSAAHAGRYAHELSGGERQRIGIARALALEPQLLILDEPVSSLDVSIQAQILNLLRDLQDLLGVAYVLIAHDLAVVRYVSHRVAVMYGGAIVETGDAPAVYGDAAHPYTRALLDAVPVADPSLRGRREPVPLQAAGKGPVDPVGCRFRPRCPRAGPRCAVEAPALDAVAGGHLVACHEAGAG